MMRFHSLASQGFATCASRRILMLLTLSHQVVSCVITPEGDIITQPCVVMLPLFRPRAGPPFLMWARCFPLLGAPVFLSVLVHHHFSVSLPVHYHQVSLHTGNPPSPLHCPVFTNHPFSLCPREFRPSNNIRTGTHWQTFGVDPPSTEYPFRLPSRAHSE